MGASDYDKTGADSAKNADKYRFCLHKKTQYDNIASYKMAIEVFNRYEAKFFLDERQCAAVKEALSLYMRSDAYNRGGQCYSICNIYFDTATDELIRRSLSHPEYKEKLRLRGYGVPLLTDTVYLEIKKKYHGKVNKRRSAFSLEEAYSYLQDTHNRPRKKMANLQVLRELDYFLHFYKLLPKAYIRYDRLAWFDKASGDFRVTIDSNIKTRRDTLRLEAGEAGEALLEDGVYLMEAKTSNCVPLWFAHLLSTERVFVSAFSKYGAEYHKFLDSKR